MIGELHIRKVVLAIDLDQGDVGLRVGADHLRGIDGAIVGCNLSGFSVVDDVIVGHGIPIRRNEESRSHSGDDLMPLHHPVG
jgi:hypothetical protein